MPSGQERRRRGQALLLLLPWMTGIAAALGIRYGYYGDRRLVLGPNSSRMMETASLFVERLHVKGELERGALLYGFNEKPELSAETNWSSSINLFVDTYRRQGLSMWLNKDSRIWMAWEFVAHGGKDYPDMLVVLFKGEQKLEKVHGYRISSHNNLSKPSDGFNREYVIGEDNMYYLGVVNLTPRSIVMNMNLKVTSKMYDTSKATSICSTGTGDCELKLSFPNTQYYVLATPHSKATLRVWRVQLSFIARLTAYLLVAVFLVIVVSILLKHLGALSSEETVRQVQVVTEAQTETDPILPVKEMPCAYGATEEDPESSVCTSAEDLYDRKICVICYDGRRVCFFTPCGHCVCCYSCGQRIMKEENRVCPICRRLIHKTRRLPST